MPSTRFAPLSLLVLAALAARPASALAGTNDEPRADALHGGTPGASGVPLIGYDGSPIVGRPFALRLSNALPGSVAAVGASVVWNPVPIPGTAGVVHVGAPLFALEFEAIGPDGRSTPFLPLASVDPSLCGVAFLTQGVVLDPGGVGGLAFTPGLVVRIGVDPDRPLLPSNQQASCFARDIAAADLDGDGLTDLVTSCWIGDYVAVHMAIGDGRFAPPQLLDQSTPSYGIELADLDGDGHDDILGSGRHSGVLDIHPGRGDGTFEPSYVHLVGGYADPVRTADLNSDGILDVVVGGFSFQSPDIRVLLGTGGGALAAPIDVAVGDGPHNFGIEDLDGDGILDLAVANVDSDDVDIRLGVGDGTFVDGVNLPAGDQPYIHNCPDLDGDGIPDLAVASYRTDELLTFLGLGGGAFAAPSATAVNFQPVDVEPLDVNGDGTMDLALAHGWGAYASVLIGRGDGTYDPPIDQGYQGPNNASTIGDFDGDGIADLALATVKGSSLPQIAVLLGDGVTGFSQIDEVLELTTASYASWTDSGDFDRDGTRDLAVVSKNSSVLEFFLGNGDGSFAPGPTFPVDAQVVVVGDLDGDGLEDVVTSSYQLDRFDVFLATGPAAFVHHSTTDVPSAGRDLTLHDFDGDGNLDLLCGALVLMGLGDGSFGPVDDLLPGIYCAASTAADWNGDGLGDVAVADSSAGDLFVRFGLTGGGFGPASLVSSGASFALGVLTADVDADGNQDIVFVAGSSPPVLLGAGDGTFTAVPAQPDMGIYGTKGGAAEDFDGDGVLDLVTIGSPLGALHLGRGDGTFVTQVEGFPLNPSQGVLTVDDFDGDGMPDVVVSYRTSFDFSTLGILLNLLVE